MPFKSRQNVCYSSSYVGQSAYSLRTPTWPPLCLLYKRERMYGTTAARVRLNSRCSSPSEPPATWWRDWALKICPSAVPVSHLVSIHPLPLSHPLFFFFPSLSAAHSADKVLDSLHFFCLSFSLQKKQNKTPSNLNQYCRINAILTFGDFKASWTQTALPLQ